MENAHGATYYAAWALDADPEGGAMAASVAKAYVSEAARKVCGEAIQVHGALGMSDDTPLAGMWRFLRMLRVADGPDEVHKMVIARRELKRWAGLSTR